VNNFDYICSVNCSTEILQMKIQSYFLLLPCVAGFFWLLAYLLFSSRGVVFRKMTRFIAVVSLFLLFTLLSLDESSRLLLHYTLFKQVCALLIIPYFLVYIYALQGTKPSSIFFKILSFVPFLQLVVGIESVFSIGYDNAVRILIDSYTFQGPMFPYLPDNSQMVFYACYTYMFKSFLLLDFLLFSISLMRCAIGGTCNIKEVLSFFFSGKKAPLRPVQFFLALLLFLIVVSALILGKTSYIESVPLAASGSLAIAFFLSLIAFVGTAGTAERQSISGILKTVRFGGQPMPDMPVSDTVDASDTEDDATVIQELAVVDEDARSRMREEIDAKLSDIVEGEELYLKRDLTLTLVADRLGVFKDELSDYIDYRYGMSFQNYINMLRISYAEKFILSHDRVTQKDIALACGFSGASSFNTAFSKKNGVTPKIWKDRQLESLRNKEA